MNLTSLFTYKYISNLVIRTCFSWTSMVLNHLIVQASAAFPGGYLICKSLVKYYLVIIHLKTYKKNNALSVTMPHRNLKFWSIRFSIFIYIFVSLPLGINLGSVWRYRWIFTCTNKIHLLMHIRNQPDCMQVFISANKMPCMQLYIQAQQIIAKISAL